MANILALSVLLPTLKAIFVPRPGSYLHCYHHDTTSESFNILHAWGFENLGEKSGEAAFFLLAAGDIVGVRSVRSIKDGGLMVELLPTVGEKQSPPNTHGTKASEVAAVEINPSREIFGNVMVLSKVAGRPNRKRKAQCGGRHVRCGDDETPAFLLRNAFL